MSVRIEGMPALRAALLRVTGEAERTTQREVKRSALNVQNGAKKRAPVGTPESTGVPGYVGGRLRNSITHRIDNNGLNAEIGTNVVYAKRVEFGFNGVDALGRRYNQRPQPYLFPALEEERGPFLRRLRRELGQAFVRAAD